MLRMGKLRSCYQNPIVDEGLWALSLDTYWAVLARYDAHSVRECLDMAWRVYAQWMPSVGQLVELLDGADRPAAVRAAEAWGECLRIASGNGALHSDAIAQEAIELLGGAHTLGRTRTDELERFTRRRFEELYQTLDQHARTQDARGRLAGGMDDRARQLVEGVANAAKLPTAGK